MMSSTFQFVLWVQKVEEERLLEREVIAFRINPCRLSEATKSVAIEVGYYTVAWLIW